MRHRNNGLRKVCDCGRRNWSKCAHDWHFNFTWRGTVHRFSLDRHLGRQLTGKTEAETEAEKIRIAIREGKFGVQAPQLETLTVRQLVAQYVEREMHSKRPRAYAREQFAIDAMLRAPLPRVDGAGELAFGDWLVVDVTTDTVERLREVRSTPRAVRREGEKVDRIVGGATAANRNLAFLRAVFNWAIPKKLVDDTPFRYKGVTVVKLRPEIRRSRRLEAGEAERLLAQCGKSLRPLVEAALETGCRLGELVSLQWSQVRTTPQPHLFLPAQKTKTKRDRRVPISPRLQAWLDMRKTDPAGNAIPGDAYVFGNAIGQKLGSIKKAWAAACARATIEDLHFHDLRREAGSRWLEGGVPLQTIQKWLGHANISQTSTYLATTEEGEFEAMRRFGARQLASACISGGDNAPQQGTTGTDARQEDPTNIDETAIDDDTSPSENHGVDSSILSLATKIPNNLNNLELVPRTWVAYG